MVASENIILYGTTESPAALRKVVLGDLSFLYCSDAVRRVCWRGRELVRAISWPIRDENWGTYQPTLVDEVVKSDADTFSAELKFSVADGGLQCVISVRGSQFGELGFEITMTPGADTFATNRAGFTVLHPITGFAGSNLEVSHSAGEIEKTIFPSSISPDQPVKDIGGLSYALDGQNAKITFLGETFEMEDQRNWSDASFKTYCVPLVFPFTYKITQQISQSVKITFSGESVLEVSHGPKTATISRGSGEIAPIVGIVVEPDWFNAADDVTSLCGSRFVRIRMFPDTPQNFLKNLCEHIGVQEVEIELVIADDVEPAKALSDAKKKIENSGLCAVKITPLREAYLNSHQPSGPWPQGPTPNEVVKQARDSLPNIEIGGGMLTNFTELNRCRPEMKNCDFLTFGSTAIVHASDDLSVCETLEALPQVFESAALIAESKPIRLGLVAIGMRSNPYGAAIVENPRQIRTTMAREDPRQRGLFAAAWAVGILSSTQGHKIEALCLAAPSGPFGIYYVSQSYPQPFYDEAPEAIIYPLFHVVKAAISMSGQSRICVSGLPHGVFAYGVETGLGQRLMISNCTPTQTAISFPHSVLSVSLDSKSFIDATQQTDWLETANKQETREIKLSAYGVVFVFIELQRENF